MNINVPGCRWDARVTPTTSDNFQRTAKENELLVLLVVSIT